MLHVVEGPHNPVYYRHCTVLLATVLNVLDQAEEHIKTDNDNGQMTKRKILSIAHKIFDPIGFTYSPEAVCLPGPKAAVPITQVVPLSVFLMSHQWTRRD
ncbi:hypothetical protein TNIN_275541 [Trichonephila inaurata madagascariensis]|uniref:Uncharacterized protein n=1 Tax=Trichonephila inaurata madagascariensis TaxID=2747483 RepID=A0A8X6Y429_9ARAC|nr:hypothetical protein TNIN_275541 [Trichonephila inaurata madagascariensis]